MLLRDKKFIRFIIVFATVFAVCYYGALFMTGIAVPGGSYSPFIEKYLNVTSWLRSSLMYGTKLFLNVFGTETYKESDYVLRAIGGKGIRLVYGCLGFGVMSFWTAYITATVAILNKKIVWLFGGLFLIWFINVIRLSLVLQAQISSWHFPFGWDHHTWFNITTYLTIFVMMFFFEKSIKMKHEIQKELHEA